MEFSPSLWHKIRRTNIIYCEVLRIPYKPNPIDRYQLMMNHLDGMVAWDSMVRIIDTYVGSLDLAEMGLAFS